MNKIARFRVLRRCNFSCHYCGRRAGDVVLEIDHIVPRAHGGTDAESNLVAACQDCNQGKSADVEMKAQLVELPNGKIEFLYSNAAVRCAMREIYGR